MITKHELIDALADKLDITKTEANKIIDVFLSLIIDGLLKGEKVYLTKIGVLQVRNRKARLYANPYNGKIFTIPARKTVYFKPSESIKNKLNTKVAEKRKKV